MMQSESFTASSVFTNGRLRVDYAAGCAYLGGEELHLTPIEYKLLCLLSKNVGKVLTHTFITQNIWGSSWDNDIASLRVFIKTDVYKRQLQLAVTVGLLEVEGGHIRGQQFLQGVQIGSAVLHRNLSLIHI